jgi:predicted PurR-regulated permease PerM
VENSPNPSNHRGSDISLAKSAYVLIIVIISLAILQIGQNFLIPLVLSFLVWSLLNALSGHIMRINVRGSHMPQWLATVVSISALGLVLLGIYLMLASQAEGLITAGPVYQENFSRLFNDLMTKFGIEQLPTSDSLFKNINIGSILSLVGGSIGNILTSIILVIIYTGFLFGEQKVAQTKLGALHRDEESARETRVIFAQITTQVQRYVWMKTIVSLLTAGLSYVVLKLVGVDFAAVWALLIFLLNFIPNIGSFLGVTFPALLALVQFDTLTPFFIITVGLGTVQFVVGNVVEPAYMGKSLNLSSFMIILSLTFWGILWGIPGMFLSVPIMVVTAIICSRFENLQWIAIVLSADGDLQTSNTKN